MDSAGFHWRCSDFELHGDILAELGHLHDFDNLLHCHWSRQRDLVHVHGEGDELCWYGCGVGCVGCCGSGDCSGCTDIGDGLFECERPVGGFLDSAGVERWCGDFDLHGDVFAWVVHL